MWKDYAVPGGTFRENLRREPGQKHVASNHPAYQFKYDQLKEKYADENGDIFINRVTEEVPVAKPNGVSPAAGEPVTVQS